MGIYNDVVSTVSNASKIKNLSDAGKTVVNTITSYKQDMGSLSKKAAEGILQFPIIVTSALDIETSQMITKALERQFATFAQVAFSMAPTIEYKPNISGADYLKRFHQNQPNMFELIMKEGYDVTETDDYVIMAGTYESSTHRLVAINKEQLINLIECARQDILNNKYVPQVEYLYNFSNDKMNAKYNKVVAEDTIGNPDPLPSDFNQWSYKDQMDYITQHFANDSDAMDDALKIVKQSTDNKKNTDVYNQKWDTIDYSKDILHDNDVKKANELIATTLHLRVKLVNKDQEQVGSIDFIVGIKGIMHPVKSNEMIMNMVSACRNNDKIFNFLRWTTGEISFFKDFYLNMNEMKKDISDKSKGASPWWIALKRRRDATGLGKLLNVFKAGKGGQLLPNASIVISAEEVEFIKSEFGFDLFDKIFVNKIMKQYFLLGFVIVDSSTQIAHFIFDGDPDFQSVTFSALERAGSNDERKFKEMLKTLNRM